MGFEKVENPSISSTESAFLLVSTKNTDFGHFQLTRGRIFVTVDNHC